MITAQQARIASNLYNDYISVSKILTFIESKISEAIKIGDYEIVIDAPKDLILSSGVNIRVREKLQNLGYYVKYINEDDAKFKMCINWE